VCTGRRFLFWWGNEPRLSISEPEVIKELLSAKNVLSYGKSQLQQKGVKDFIGKGLLMANGQDWLNQRRVTGPAFRHENLKVLDIAIPCTLRILTNKFRDSGLLNIMRISWKCFFSMVLYL